MSEIIEIKNKHEEWATINWQVNDWCNYRCSYCNDFNRGGENKNNSNIDAMLSFLESLINLYKQNNIHYFKLAITGGEPSVWKGLIPLVDKFRDLVGYEGHLLSLNTNLSRDLRWWEDHYPRFNRIIASFHPEFTDQDEYFEKYKFLQDKVDILARIMMHKDKFTECIDFATRIKQNCQNYHIGYAPILSTLAPDVLDYQYTDASHMEFLKNHNNEKRVDNLTPLKNKIKTLIVDNQQQSEMINIQQIVNEKKNSFYNWRCDIYKGVFVSSSGDVSLATCGQGMPVGNIFQNNLNLNFLNSVICKKEWCLCDTDISIPKRKIVD